MRPRESGVRASVLFAQFPQDVRYGLRTLFREPGFSIAIVLTLAVGIGANVAMFSVANGVLFRPLPYPQPNNLVVLNKLNPQRATYQPRLSDADFVACRDGARTLERLGAYERIGCNVSGAGDPVRYQAANVSAELFDVLGVKPSIGRTFRSGEDAPGRPRLGVLSFSEWQQRYGGDAAVLGRSILVDGVPVEIVGVMPSGFGFPDAGVQLWLSLSVDPDRAPSSDRLLVLGRLKAGATPREAQAETTQILGGVEVEGISTPGGSSRRTTVIPLLETITGRSRESLLVLLGSVTLVFLIACANVTNMLLARSQKRGRELALRFALGATRSRIVQQLLTECLLLGAMGSAAGLAVAAMTLHVLETLRPWAVPRLQEISIDGTVMVVAVTAGLLATALFGAAPAWRVVRADSASTTRMRVTSSPANRRANGVFVVLQVASSLVLLVGSGLLLRSLQHLVDVHPGFDTRHLVTLNFELPPQSTDEDDDSRVVAFARGVVENVQGLPGIESAALASALPFTGYMPVLPVIAETHMSGGEGAGQPTQVVAVSPGYFGTIGISVLRGRDFEGADKPDSAQVAIVDEALARRDWPDADPIGRRVRLPWDLASGPWCTVVGVVASTRDRTVAGGPKEFLYLPLSQAPFRRLGLVMRTSLPPRSLVESLRKAVSRVDENIPGYGVRTLEDAIAATASQERFASLLFSAFGGIALLLSAIGIHGVMSLEVSSRLKEFAIRAALGATSLENMGLVTRHAAKLMAAGIGAGIAGALGLTRLLRGLLYQAEPFDPATWVAVVVVLLFVALLACMVPADRARRTDPAVLLRED